MSKEQADIPAMKTPEHQAVKELEIELRELRLYILRTEAALNAARLSAWKADHGYATDATVELAGQSAQRLAAEMFEDADVDAEADK